MKSQSWRQFAQSATTKGNRNKISNLQARALLYDKCGLVNAVALQHVLLARKDLLIFHFSFSHCRLQGDTLGNNSFETAFVLGLYFLIYCFGFPVERSWEKT